MTNYFSSNFTDKCFINPAIENGIQAFLSMKKNNEFDRTHTFEMYVIKALTIIYGEKSIILPYEIDNEKAFECNLLIYEFKETEMKKFIKYMNSYHEFVQNINSGIKATGLINEIEKLLIEMINKRAKRHPFSEEELKEFDTIFNPSNGDLKSIKKLCSTDNGLIIKTWQDKHEELTNTQIRLMAINPNLLSPSEYAKFGYDIKEVAIHTEEEILKINNEISKAKFLSQEQPMKKITKKKNKLVLTSGNGFVDKLMLLSILSTEIMIGLIIATRIGG